MSQPRVRALILAAGVGTRLQPLTSFIPKPLLPVTGSTLVELTLDRLVAAGCEAAAVNLHHLPDEIRGHLGDEHRGMPLVYSLEPEERQGTLGALHPLRDFLGQADVILLVNGDSLCPWPFPKLLRRHRGTGAAATLLLAGAADPEDYGGGVAIDKEGRLLSFHAGDAVRGEVAARHVFAGAHVLSPQLLERVESGPSDIVRELYKPLLAEGLRIQTLVTRKPWHDMGKPRRYLEGVLDHARGNWLTRLWRRNWVSGDATVAAGAKLAGAAVEAGAAVGERAKLERTLVLAGATVGPGARLTECGVGPGADVPGRARGPRQGVVAARRDLPSTDGDSHVEGQVYSPLDAVRRNQNPGY